MSCAVLNCTKRSNKRTNIRFFTFPKDEAVVQEWLKYCKPIRNIKRARVCSIHFIPSDYNKTLRQILFNPQRSRALRPDAVPSLHLNLTNYGQSHAETILRDATSTVSESGSNWYPPPTQTAHWSSMQDDEFQPWQTRVEVSIEIEDTKIETKGNAYQEQRQDCPTTVINNESYSTTNVQYHAVEEYQTQKIPTDLAQKNQHNESNTLHKKMQNKQEPKTKRIQNLKKQVKRLKNTVAGLQSKIEEMEKNKCKCQKVTKSDLIEVEGQVPRNSNSEAENGKKEIKSS